jgi:hypothetical protein
LNHFVHYSTVTRGLVQTYQGAAATATAAQGKNDWTRYFQESPPSERHVDEVNEAMMIHTKSLDIGQTQNWKNKCRFDFARKYLGCHVGFPWPNSNTNNGLVASNTNGTYDAATGWEYNCFVNQRVDSYWIPRLEEAMAKRKRNKRSAT